MTVESASTKYIIEPLDPSKHDRGAFSCGIEQVDNYFRKTANKLAKSDNVRVHCMVGSSSQVIGFYAINAHSVHFSELPDRFARNRPSHGQIPAAYISMIGVDKQSQGQGFGGDLLVDCFKRIALAARAVGIRMILLNVLDCGDAELVERRRRLYMSYGFNSLPANALRMFLPVADVEALIAQ